MTAAQLKANVDTILDEVTGASTFTTTTEVYQALADGQNEVISLFLSVYRMKKKLDPEIALPFELESILNDDTGTDDSVSIPTGFQELIAATYDHDGAGKEVGCKIKDNRRIAFDEDNTFIIATATDPVAYIKSVSDTLKIVFLPAKSGTPAFTIHFLKTPADIASGVNPTLPATTHNAILLFAVSRLLEKDQRFSESQGYYNQFLQEMKLLLGV